MSEENPKYQVKAFRENGTPTVNRPHFYNDLEVARKHANEIADAMGAGYVQIGEFDSRPDYGFYMVLEHFESRGAKLHVGSARGWEYR